MMGELRKGLNVFGPNEKTPIYDIAMEKKLVRKLKRLRSITMFLCFLEKVDIL